MSRRDLSRTSMLRPLRLKAQEVFETARLSRCKSEHVEIVIMMILVMNSDEVRCSDPSVFLWKSLLHQCVQTESELRVSMMS